jgi:hypothetical protein
MCSASVKREIEKEREGAEITAIPAAISGCFSPSCVSLTRSAATCYL